jgi:hypothetical protein
MLKIRRNLKPKWHLNWHGLSIWFHVTALIHSQSMKMAKERRCSCSEVTINIFSPNPIELRMTNPEKWLVKMWLSSSSIISWSVYVCIASSLVWENLNQEYLYYWTPREVTASTMITLTMKSLTKRFLPKTLSTRSTLTTRNQEN